MAYMIEGQSPASLMNHQIAGDVLSHLSSIIDACVLRKLNQRSRINQAAYAVAKRFGHISDHPDLYLWHGSLAPNLLFFQGDQCIAVNLQGITLCYRVWLLGKQSQKAPGKLQQSADPNEVCIYLVGGGRQVNVTIDLSGPALLQLCADNGKRVLARRFSEMLSAKWGNSGVKFNNVDTNERLGQIMNRPELGNHADAHGELYLYRRYRDGVLINWNEGIGFIS